MIGRILCLLGLHVKVLVRSHTSLTASDVYCCRCARPTCKWSASATNLPRSSLHGKAVRVIAPKRLRV